VKYSRMFSVAVAAAAIAGSGVWGMSHSGGSVGPKVPVVTADAANVAKAASEETCTDTGEVSGGHGYKANVSMCASTNGQALKVKFSANCFSAAGGNKYDTCVPNGFWSLYKGETLVADGRASGSALYPGPGTYTLKASVYVTAQGMNSGFTAKGEVSKEITLTTAILPGPRLNGGTNYADGTLTVTVTNVGGKPATGVKIYIDASSADLRTIRQRKIAITDDKQCSGKSIFLTECRLGSLDPGSSVSVKFASGATSLCNIGERPTFTYSYTADGLVPLGGYGPC
jgi:hypothetical protein